MAVPEPLAEIPIAVFVFDQLTTAPPGLTVKLMPDTEEPEHTDCEFEAVIVGVIFTLTCDTAVDEQPLEIPVTV